MEGSCLLKPHSVDIGRRLKSHLLPLLGHVGEIWMNDYVIDVLFFGRGLVYDTVENVMICIQYIYIYMYTYINAHIYIYTYIEYLHVHIYNLCKSAFILYIP